MSSTTPSHAWDSPDDHRSLLNVVSLVTTSGVIIVIFTRLVTRWSVSRSLGVDDAFILFSCLCAVGETISLFVAVAHGLGLVNHDLPGHRFRVQEKALYSALILFVMSQSLAKTSIVFFVIALSPVVMHRKVSHFTLGAIGIWTLTSLFGFAFTCSPPSVWNYASSSCIYIKAFYTYVEAASAAIDVVLVILPSIITWRLQIRLNKKITVIAFFASRILIVVASTIQLVFLYQDSNGSKSFLGWQFVLIIQIIQTIGIVSACGPYLKPLLDNISSGMIRSDDIRRRTKLSSARDSNKSYRSRLRNALPAKPFYSNDSHATNDSVVENELMSMQGRPNVTYSSEAHATDERDFDHGFSDSSNIRQTRTYEIVRTPEH